MIKKSVLMFAVFAAAVSVLAVEEIRYNGMKYFGPPSDWISVRLDGYSDDELPAVYADMTKRKVIVRHEVPNLKDVHGPKGFPFLMGKGELTVRLRSWDGSLVRTLGTRKPPKYWSYGQEISFPLDMKDIEPGAYVITAELPPHIREEGVFNPTNTGSGSIGVSMLYGRNAMRLAVFSNTEPGKIFGVGNGMIHIWKHWSGCELQNSLEARDLKPVLVGEGDVYHDAIIGCPGTEGLYVDALGPTNVPGMNNPAAKMLDIFSEPGRGEMKRRAKELGERLGRCAGIAAVKLGNEAPTFNRGRVCPTDAADSSFREWCRRRFKGDLKAANAKWGRSFASWNEVRQPIYCAEGVASVKTGAASLDWYANMGRIGKDLVEYLNCPENVEFAMEWYRWRTRASIMMYANFAHEAKKYDKKTLYSNNYCWPNFFSHLVLPTWRRLDAAMLDCQYVCAFPRTLGRNSEMIEILEMAESAMRDKPILGREIYVQPHYPAEMTALQNWAMVAHGMRANLVFGWKPYSDHGQKVFNAGPRAWERKEDSVPMWMIIDTDGTRLPAYEGVKRSAEEIAAFHAKYDGLSIKRMRGRVAVYLSDETSMYTMLKTGDRPYNEERLCHTRDWLADELRLAGVRIEYLDDEVVGELTSTDYDIVVIPPMPRIAPGPAAQLAAFEHAGGRIIRLEDVDPELIAKHPELPRSAWFEPESGPRDVEVVVRAQEKTRRRFVFVLNRGKAVKGVLKGSDFAEVKTLHDAIADGESGLSLSLGDYGYRVFEFEK